MQIQKHSRFKIKTISKKLDKTGRDILFNSDREREGEGERERERRER